MPENEIATVPQEEILPTEPMLPPHALMALTPTELGNAQSALSNWCQKKIDYIRGEMHDLEQSIAIAKKSKWNTNALKGQLNKAQKGVTFYAKIKEAVTAGYLVIPDFPIDVFAIRRTTPGHNNEYALDNRTQGRNPSDGQAPQPAHLLPVGDGEYYGKHAASIESGEYQTKKDGEREWVTYFKSANLADVHFPVSLAKPYIMDATRKAMSLKIFDEIGLIGPQRRRDPIIVGRVLDGRSAKTWPQTRQQYLNFFIAWYLNWEML